MSIGSVTDWEAENLTETQIRSYVAYLVGDMRYGGANHDGEIDKLRQRLADILKGKIEP